MLNQKLQKLQTLLTQSSAIEHPKISHRLSKTIKQTKKVSQVSSTDNPLYKEIKRKILEWKNVKITKGTHAYRCYGILIMLSFYISLIMN